MCLKAPHAAYSYKDCFSGTMDGRRRCLGRIHWEARVMTVAFGRTKRVGGRACNSCQVDLIFHLTSGQKA